ncbi:MAG: cupredoxin domain-containing protein [Polyangiaceae bacterium]
MALLATLLGSGSLLAAGGGAVVKGKVTGWEKLLPQVYAEVAKPDSHRFTWREPSPTVKQDFRKLSANVTRDVCVAAFGSGPAAAHEPLTVKVTGGRITPSTIVLSPGSRLSFKNADPFPHKLYENGNAAWGPNPIAPGSRREWAAGAAGLHVIRDELFPSIVMYVVIEPNVVEHDFPDREGTFQMNLPPGEYTLKAFFDGKPTGKPIDGVKVDTKGVELKEPLSVGGDSK